MYGHPVRANGCFRFNKWQDTLAKDLQISFYMLCDLIIARDLIPLEESQQTSLLHAYQHVHFHRKPFPRNLLVSATQTRKKSGINSRT